MINTILYITLYAVITAICLFVLLIFFRSINKNSCIKKLIQYEQIKITFPELKQCLIELGLFDVTGKVNKEISTDLWTTARDMYNLIQKKLSISMKIN